MNDFVTTLQRIAINETTKMCTTTLYKPGSAYFGLSCRYLSNRMDCGFSHYSNYLRILCTSNIFSHLKSLSYMIHSNGLAADELDLFVFNLTV